MEVNENQIRRYKMSEDRAGQVSVEEYEFFNETTRDYEHHDIGAYASVSVSSVGGPCGDTHADEDDYEVSLEDFELNGEAASYEELKELFGEMPLAEIVSDLEDKALVL